MTLTDMNQSWKVPEGYTFHNVMPQGAYLVVTYGRRQDIPGWTISHQVVIYVNDQGREVMRTETLVQWPAPGTEPESKPAPVGRWFRVKNGFYLMLEGLQEMSQCLKK